MVEVVLKYVINLLTCAGPSGGFSHIIVLYLYYNALFTTQDNYVLELQHSKNTFVRYTHSNFYIFLLTILQSFTIYQTDFLHLHSIYNTFKPTKITKKVGPVGHALVLKHVKLH